MVVAERYRHRGKPWIPVLSYTLATVISCSRITETAHFPSDVWLGSAGIHDHEVSNAEAEISSRF